MCLGFLGQAKFPHERLFRSFNLILSFLVEVEFKLLQVVHINFRVGLKVLQKLQQLHLLHAWLVDLSDLPEPFFEC